MSVADLLYPSIDWCQGQGELEADQEQEPVDGSGSLRCHLSISARRRHGKQAYQLKCKSCLFLNAVIIEFSTNICYRTF